VTKTSRIGIICEDPTDYEALKVIIRKTINTTRVGFKPKVGNGCSKIRSKCIGWAEDLSNRRCDMLIVVHDLDRRNYKQLHTDLTQKLARSAIDNNFVSIPIEELEAWLLADPKGVMEALNLKRLPRFKGLPETITSPKEKLADEIFMCSRKEIEYQTTMNARIAKHIDLQIVMDRCPSFKLFHDYISGQTYI
jgi:hypothetical protein